MRNEAAMGQGRGVALAWLAPLALLTACGGDGEVGKDSAALADAAGDAGAVDDAGAGADAGDAPAVDAPAADSADAPGDILGPGKPCKVLGDCGDVPGPCTGWVCDSKLGCVAVLAPADAVCNSGDDCFLTGRCDGAACKPEQARDCDDALDCTSDGCENGACVHLPIEASQNVACDDGDACTVDDLCKAGNCKGGASVCLCQSDADCDALSGGDKCKGQHYCAVLADGSRACKLNPATVVQCDPKADSACKKNSCDPKAGTCALVEVKDGKACSDGEKCTDGETCQGGVCLGGVAVCCQGDADCKGKDDGDLCNGTYFCNKASGLCQFNPATVISCPTVDDSACSKNTCDAKLGTCAKKAAGDGTLCDDGNPCTPGNEACKGGACSSATNTCLCKSDADCKGKDDGDLCNGTLYCAPSTGTCAPNPATVVSCPTVDDSACVKATCEPKSGACKPKAVADGSACDADGTVCTPNDTCQAGVCQPDSANTCACATTAECSKYDDGDLCNGSLFCDVASNVCRLNKSTIVGCPSSDNTACSKSICQPATGKCAMTFVHQGEVCEDGEPCTKGDVCDNGQCKKGTDVCLCHGDLDCKSKEDGDFCNGTLYCDKATVPWDCQVKPSTVITCPTVNDSACQQSTCQGATGKCEILLINIDGPCEDDDPCTVATVCKGGLCLNPNLNADKPCDDDNPCSDDSCDKAFGCKSVANKAGCDDGDACTEGDSCSAKVCQKGKAKVCDDGNGCTTDVCNAKQGCVVFNNSDSCSDGDGCTVGDGCKGGACAPGKAKVCKDANPCSLDSCDSKTGNCVFDSKATAAVVCGDGVACTIETCDPLLGCKYTSVDSACDDGLACTVDVCAGGGGCKHTASDAACDDSNACSDDSCVVGAGCVHANAGDGSACFDDDPCTFGDSCSGGKCKAGPKSASCNVDAQQCAGKADGAACNDGDACTKGETCLGGVCALLPKATRVRTFLGVAKGDQHRNGHRLHALTRRVSAIALSPDGGILFGSDATPMLRRVELDGQVRTLAGNGEAAAFAGTGLAAQIGAIAGIAVAANGTAYVSDGSNHRVWSVTPVGVATIVAGSGAYSYADGAALSAHLRGPAGLVVRTDGKIVVADTVNHCLRLLDLGAKTLTTLAGKGGVAGNADGDAATARFSKPYDVARLPAGALAVADRDNHRIRLVKADGAVTTLAGSVAGTVDGKGSAARFNQPSGLAATSAGVVYVADALSHRIRRVLPDGTVTTLVGSTAGALDGLAAGATFSSPRTLALDAFGALLVGELYETTMRRIELPTHGCDDDNPCTHDTCDAQSGACGVAKGAVCDDGEPCSTDSCAADTGTCSFSNVVVGAGCDDGQACTIANLCGFGRCYAGAKVEQLSAGGAGKKDGAIGAYQVYGPRGMTRRHDGVLFLADGSNNLVRKIDHQGTMTTFAGAPFIGAGYLDGPATVARFSAPVGIAARADGSLVVTEVGNDRVRAVAVDGSVTTLAGAGVAGYVDGASDVARFADPLGATVDASGAVLVVDSGNHRLRRIDAGTVTTFVGVGSGWRDGPASVARFNYPAAIANAPDGSFVVADGNTHVLRRVAPDGTVTTIAGRLQGASDDGDVFGGALVSPDAVLVTPSGAILAAGSDGLIRMVLPDGRLRTILGQPGWVKGVEPGVGPLGRVRGIAGMALDDQGRVIASDQGAHAIVRVTLPLLDCDDGNACTADSCGAKKGCAHVGLTSAAGQSALCDDGDPCSAGDACKAGACQSGAKLQACKCGAGVSCDDGDACTVDSCDGSKGCGHSANVEGAACDDGNACSPDSACLGKGCAAAPTLFAVARLAGGFTDSPGPQRDGSGAVLGGAAAVARFGKPSGLCYDAKGTLYAADEGQHSVRAVGSDGVVRTIAGGDFAGGDGLVDGPTRAARFSSPIGIDVDATGVLWVADRDNHALRRVEPQGVTSTAAGAVANASGKPTAGFVDGKGNAARFKSPRGVAIAGNGALIVADTGNHALRSVAADLEVTTLLGGSGSAGLVDGPASVAMLRDPWAVDVAADGTIYFVEYGNNTLRRVSNGVVMTLVGRGPGGGSAADGFGVLGGQMLHPVGVAFDDASGRVFVVEGLGRLLRLWHPGLGLVTVAGDGSLASKPGLGVKAKLGTPGGLALHPDGHLAISDGQTGRINLVRPVLLSCDDANACTADACDATKGCSHKPLAADKACTDGGPCQLGVCDAASGQCSYQPRPNGTLCGPAGTCDAQCASGVCRRGGLLERLVASPPGAPGLATLYAPIDIEPDGEGAFIVSNRYSHRLVRVSKSGVLSHFSGSGKAGYVEGAAEVANFSEPMGLSLRADGSFAVADRGNSRIRVVAKSGSVATLAGSGATGFADGPTTLAKFNYPTDVIVAGDGALLVADFSNHVVRRVTTDAKVETVAGIPGSAGTLNGPAGVGKLASPQALALDAKGALWIACDGGSTLRRLSASGLLEVAAGTPGDVGGIEGDGPLASSLFGPSALLARADGTVLVGEQQGHAVRRVWPFARVETVVGGFPGKGAEGFGFHARIAYASGMADAGDGSILVADANENAIWRLRTDLSACAALTGATATTAATSCAAITKAGGVHASEAAYIDPDGPGPLPVFKTQCDHVTAGGGWTRFDASWSAAAIAALVGAKGQYMRACSHGSSANLISPATTTAWSWTAKKAVAGTWTVDGKAVVCGADASFADIACGAGIGCADKPGPGANLLLPGMSAVNGCATPEAAFTGGAMSVCGKANHATWALYARAAP